MVASLLLPQSHFVGNSTISDDSIRQNIQAISEPNQPEDKRVAAWKEVLKTPEKSFDLVMVYSAVGSLLEDSRSEWDEDDAARWLCIAGFGDVAAARLLRGSGGCSFLKRYRIAHLLTLLLPGSRELIQKTADDETIDADRHQTALLALTLKTMPPEE